MTEKILLISENEDELNLIKETLLTQGFSIHNVSVENDLEALILNEEFSAIIADLDLLGERVHHCMHLLQEKRSRSCFILYGDQANAEKVSTLLQSGVYAFIARDLLGERIDDTLLGGLENRKAFIEILKMMDDLKEVNIRLQREKEALRQKNQELSFLNRLSSEIAYDLNWDRIIPRILEAGLIEILDPALLGILHRIGSEWNLSVFISGREINKEVLEGIKESIMNRFHDLTGEKISGRELGLHLYPSNVRFSSSQSPVPSNQIVLPLNLVGKPQGLLVIMPNEEGKGKDMKGELISTMANILAMSLENAQEYYRLKDLTVKDSLTGVFNRKGFMDFVQREFQRARRYKKTLALVMIDVDNFKSINDSLGHPAGDYVLKELARCLKSSLRNTDIVARYGGDEFAIILPETKRAESEMLMTRVVSSIKEYPFQWNRQSIEVGISYGISIAEDLKDDGNESDLIATADDRLYRDKESKGRPYSLAGEG